MNKILTALASLGVAAAVSAQSPMEGDLPSEQHFRRAGIAVRLVAPDSVLVTVGAGSEDLQNTVGVFPYLDSDSAQFRLFEQRLEAYLQTRVPVRVDGKRLSLKVTQWKPGGRDREDRLDMKSLYVRDLFVTLGGKLPPGGKMLDVTANMWVERRDAAETVVQFSFFEGHQALRREWTRRERLVRFPLSADSLAVMRKNPPPPLQRTAEDHDDHDDHDDHEH